MARKVLLIDDDRMQCRIIGQYLRAFRSRDYKLEWCADYAEGLARLLRGDCAVCLLDYQLGGRDGLELIREAQRQGNRTPIIFLTAETREAVDIEAMNAGALDYLVKGQINPAQLERALRYALKLGETLAALQELATRDALTGLLNRRELDRILREETERSGRFGRGFALLLLDVDHFKAVNDNHGHQAGDAALREIARRLREGARQVDRVARLGGEEFAVVMIEAGADAGRQLAERLRAAVAGQPVAVGAGRELRLTLSAGVAEHPRDGRGAADLVRAADRALYAAKAAGRDRVVVCGETPAD